MTGADVLVLGGGPAGRALAGECARLGLRTTLADPAPERGWRATYGAWADELPPDLPGDAVAAGATARAIGTTEHLLAQRYVVLRNAGLRAHLDGRMAGVRVLAARAAALPVGRAARGPQVVPTVGGPALTAALVVDATGAPSALRRRRPGPAAEQTAYGVVLPAADAAPLLCPGEALFMDWRPDHGHHGSPTFLYAVPLGDGAVLLEETSLAGRPGLALTELRARLHARLRAHGIAVPDGAVSERVRFPLDEPRPSGPAVAFGAATPLVHPASGFSVAAALGIAPALAAALAAHLPDSPTAARAAAERLLWPPSARAVHRLRLLGLRTVLDLPATAVPAFFEGFFRLPSRHRSAFLSGRDDLTGTALAMTALLRTVDAPVRARMLRSAVSPSPLRHLLE